MSGGLLDFFAHPVEVSTTRHSLRRLNGVTRAVGGALKQIQAYACPYSVQRTVITQYSSRHQRHEFFVEISDHAKHFTARVVRLEVIATELVQPNGFRQCPENEQ